MRLVQTTAEVPTCGASTRAPTISSTMTRAPQQKAMISSIVVPYAGVPAKKAGSVPPSGKEVLSRASTPPICQTR